MAGRVRWKVAERPDSHNAPCAWSSQNFQKEVSRDIHAAGGRVSNRSIPLPPHPASIPSPQFPIEAVYWLHHRPYKCLRYFR